MLNQLIVALLSSGALAGLIFLLRRVTKVQVWDERWHACFVTANQGWFWRGVAWVTQPKLMVCWCFLLAVVQWSTRGWPGALGVLAGLGGANVIGIIIKHTLKRPRPVQHLAHDDGYSFPSGHVLGTTVMTVMLWQLYGPAWWLAGSLVLWWGLVAYSRLTLQAHYPSDVVGAVLLALSWLSWLKWLIQLLGWF